MEDISTLSVLGGSHQTGVRAKVENGSMTRVLQGRVPCAPCARAGSQQVVHIRVPHACEVRSKYLHVAVAGDAANAH